MINSDTYFDIKAIIQELEPRACRALPLFYAISGGDIVSSLYKKEKCKMFNIWLNNGQKKVLTDFFHSSWQKSYQDN